MAVATIYCMPTNSLAAAQAEAESLAIELNPKFPVAEKMLTSRSCHVDFAFTRRTGDFARSCWWTRVQATSLVKGGIPAMFRLPLIIFVPIFFSGCDQNAVRARVDAIREHNAKLDQASKIRVLHEVKKHWAIKGDVWLGRLPDGSMLRLDSPVVTVLPAKKGKPFCCNWLGEVTITANHWQSHPASSLREPFVIKYQALMESAEHYSLTAISGGDVISPSDKEMAEFNQFTRHLDSF